MKLYDVPNNSRIRVLDDTVSRPPGDAAPLGDVLNFQHVDGMYSLCTTNEGHAVHLAAWTDVEVVTDE